jgi:hypothetical protein
MGRRRMSGKGKMDGKERIRADVQKGTRMGGKEPPLLPQLKFQS